MEQGPNYDELDVHFQKMDSGVKESQAPKNHSQNGFVDVMRAMKANQPPRTAVPDRPPSAAPIGTQRHASVDQTMSPQSKADRAAADAVYEQLVMENMSEDKIYPPDEEPKAYNYTPSRPK